MYLRPIDVAVALSLYGYNVSAHERAKAIYEHFDGDCAEMKDLILQVSRGYAATELAPPSAVVYVEQALKMYGDEATRRNQVNGIGHCRQARVPYTRLGSVRSE